MVEKTCAVFPHTIAIYAFGSQINGNVGHASDLNLAVLVAGHADPLALWDVAGGLAEVVGCARLSCWTEGLNLHATSTVMQYQVIATGKRLWSSGLQAWLFECFVLSEKTDLDIARAPLFADIKSTGKIYAR